MHDAIPSRILNGWLRLEEDLFHLQVLSSLPPKIPICFIIANDLPKRNRSHPERSGRLRSVHSINACQSSAASTPPAPLSSPRSAPSASPHIPRAYAHTHLLVKLLDGELNGQERVQKASVLFSTILCDDACVLCLNQPSFDQLGHIFAYRVRTHIDCASNRPVARMALICRPILNVHQVAVDSQGAR